MVPVEGSETTIKEALPFSVRDYASARLEEPRDCEVNSDVLRVIDMIHHFIEYDQDLTTLMTCRILP